MHIILQPIVGNGQQPMCGTGPTTMQVMVAIQKIEAREEFGRNLNAALERLPDPPPRRGRPEWLRRQLDNVVSRESCRKWLAGIEIPDQANMSLLLKKFRFNEQELRIGEWSAPPNADKGFTELQEAWATADASGRETLLAVARTVKRTVVSARQTKRRA